MPSPDSERCRETYNSPDLATPDLMSAARETCRLLEERADCIRKLRRLNEQLMGENERVAAAQKAAEQALSGSELEVLELQRTVVSLRTQAQHDHKLAQEWQQRANELGTEVEVLRDKDRANEQRIGELLRSLQAADLAFTELDARVRAAGTRIDAERAAVLAITNSPQELADDWYADERERLIEATGCGTPTA